ncbi:transcriptional regulator [Xenorhabdus vietnamensis]|uniref:Transcriptional regulator n=1 Tax=Xenorhabdus vietnamensis TaxID=351656 RepID=A0A1Y2S908_9GAMM|nr:helix-turn-helix transcriptional regulator [Xenorhabdus vietnamensis]OTA14622.1 transcriptional regulator [Xenorhabdus vietnamensis]
MLIRNIFYLMSIHGIKSVAKLAERLEINQPTLHRTLSGEIKDPKYSTLKTIAEFFGRTPGELMDCDLSVIDGDSPHIYPIDGPEPKYQNFPPEIKTAVINVYKEIVTREAKLFPDPTMISHQTTRLENLAETLVSGFSKLIES